MSASPQAAPVTATARGIAPPALLALAAVALLGLARLPEPFAWDQAMFMLGARVMDHGGVLYRDYWDPKQPGLFAFYWLAGRLFGFDETGVHLLELVWMTAFAVTLVLTLRRHLPAGWALAAAPLLVVGWYFAVCTDWHLTQIEGLVGLPLWLELVCATRAATDAPRAPAWWLAAGVAGGVALTFKLLLLPVVLAIGLVALAASTRKGAGALGAAGIAATAGIALPLAAGALYFVAHGALPLALWTNLGFPAEVVRRAHGFRIGPFLDGLGWFARTWAPMLPFAAVGAWSALRPRLEPLWAALVAWFVAGVFAILIQRLSYWEYQYLLLSVPVALLAVRGLTVIAPALAAAAPAWGARERGVVLALAALLMAAPPLVPALGRLATLAHHRFATTAIERRAYQDRVSRGGGYPKISADLGPLAAPGARPGAIWVLGNPLYYWLSGREQAVPRNGASFIEFMTPAEWDTLTTTLERARPAYLHVQRDYDPLLGPRHPETAGFVRWLERAYEPVSTDPRGTWYAPRAAE